MTPAADTAGDAHRNGALVAVLAVLFVALRLAIAWSRDPFFDELFTVWMARRPFSGILPALEHDSGPPLYYLLARYDSVGMLRMLSLVVAAVPLGLLLRQRRWTAALLLAVHPAAALFAVTARPYALCAAFIAIAVLLLERDRVWPAAAALSCAAYTHYYGVLFFPTLLFCRAPLKQRILAGAAAAATFVPGLLLSLVQPKEAVAWMNPPGLQDLLSAVSFLGDDVGASAPVTLVVFLLTAIGVARSWRHAGFVLVPLILAVGLSLIRPAYYPVRFASVVAFPLVLWIAQSTAIWSVRVRQVLLLALSLTGVVAIGVGVLTHLEGGLSDYREAALVLRRHAGPTETVVATGFLYLETVHQLPDARVRAFPREQAVHPGWRVPATHEVDVSPLPATDFVWIGESRTREEGAIRTTRSTRVLFENERALILRVFARPVAGSVPRAGIAGDRPVPEARP